MTECKDVAVEEKARALQEFIRTSLPEEFPESGLIAVLHKAQEIYGFMDPEALRIVSRQMRIPMSHIWGVATFYHYFNLEPRGKFVISVCRGTACYVKGGQKVLDAVVQELGVQMGETTPDMLFTLLETRCLGACGLAPVMMINNRIYGELTPAKAVEILNRYRSGAA